ncbi:hypothetical protein PINS_up021330 [Pythium insidiosum]|nr:hypothetical protein PINS_up021330 [Pythium insidiosum]
MAEQGPHVTWDEETIALHDAERGTRMKIEEPKTPSLSLQHGAPSPEWKELQVKLEGVQDRKRSEWDSSDDEEGATRFAARDDEGKKIVKDPKFAEKRKMHYNEFERLRQWRQQHAHEEEEDEEGEDEKEEEGEKENVRKAKMVKSNAAEAVHSNTSA